MMMSTHAELIGRLQAVQPMPRLIEFKMNRKFGAINLTMKWRGRTKIRLIIWS